VVSRKSRPILFEQLTADEQDALRRAAETAMELPQETCLALLHDYPVLLSMRIEEQVRSFVDDQTRRLSISTERASRIAEDFLWPILTSYSSDEEPTQSPEKEAAEIVSALGVSSDSHAGRLAELITEAIAKGSKELRTNLEKRRALDRVVPGAASFWASADIRAIWAEDASGNGTRAANFVPVAGVEVRIGERQGGRRLSFSCTEPELQFVVSELNRVLADVRALGPVAGELRLKIAATVTAEREP
jgi:hypothetical protein